MYFQNMEIKIFIYLQELFCSADKINRNCLRLAGFLEITNDKFSNEPTPNVDCSFVTLYKVRRLDRIIASSIVIKLHYQCSENYYGNRCFIECTEDYRRLCSYTGDLCKPGWIGVMLYNVDNRYNQELFLCLVSYECDMTCLFCVIINNETICHKDLATNSPLNTSSPFIKPYEALWCLLNIKLSPSLKYVIFWKSPYTEISFKIKNNSITFKDPLRNTFRISLSCILLIGEQVSYRKDFTLKFCVEPGLIFLNSSMTKFRPCERISCNTEVFSIFFIINLNILNTSNLIKISSNLIEIPKSVSDGIYSVECTVKSTCDNIQLSKYVYFEIKNIQYIKTFPPENILKDRMTFGCYFTSTCNIHAFYLIQIAGVTNFSLQGSNIYGYQNISFEVNQYYLDGYYSYKCCLFSLECDVYFVLKEFYVNRKTSQFPDIVPDKIYVGDNLYCLSGKTTMFAIDYIFMSYIDNFSFTTVQPYNVMEITDSIYNNRIIFCNCTYFHLYSSQIIRNEVVKQIVVENSVEVFRLRLFKIEGFIWIFQYFWLYYILEIMLILLSVAFKNYLTRKKSPRVDMDWLYLMHHIRITKVMTHKVDIHVELLLHGSIYALLHDYDYERLVTTSKEQKLKVV